MKKRFSIDPGICPKCRSVRTEVKAVMDHKIQRYCASCQSMYIQHFSGPQNMSPDYITDMKNNQIWPMEQVQYDADGHIKK